jgi:hypothetical protein
MIPHPTKTYRAKNGAIGFKFDVKDFPNGESDGMYYVRGAICWPVLNEITGKAQGFAMLAAQRTSSKVIVVMESTPFTHIENIVEDGKLIWEGLVDWFRAVWQKYYADSFFWTGSPDTHHQYLLQVIRCEDIKPSPWFVEIHISDMDDAINTLYNMKSKDLLVLDDASRLVKDLTLWEQTGRKQVMPSVQALLALTSGYARYPFRAQEEE